MLLTSALFSSVTDIAAETERSEPSSSIQKRNANACKYIKNCFA